jgi:5-formyltetrahydrofolate cyclo-ligase
MVTKAELRKQYLSRRKTISAEELESASSRIAENFFSDFDLRSVRTLHTFLPIEKLNEINTRLIIAKLWRDFPQIQTVVPRVDRHTNFLSSLKFTHETELVRNAWGIDEPADDEVVEAALIDIVLVPGVCFDRAGHRVGYGKGFYDRYLASCRPDCVKIGLSYFEPVDAIENTHDGDVRVDFVVTPETVHRLLPPA